MRRYLTGVPVRIGTYVVYEVYEWYIPEEIGLNSHFDAWVEGKNTSRKQLVNVYVVCTNSTTCACCRIEHIFVCAPHDRSSSVGFDTAGTTRLQGRVLLLAKKGDELQKNINI